jgi:hypothetical protein
MNSPKFTWLTAMLSSRQADFCRTGSCSSPCAGSISTSRRTAKIGFWPVLVLLCLLVTLRAPASAQGPTQETWAPTDPKGLWSDGGNWNPNTKPGGPNGNFNVVIPHLIGPPPPTMDVSATIVNLQIAQNETLNITNGSQLTVTGTSVANDGQLQIDNNGGGSSGRLNISNTVTLSGTGNVFMGASVAAISGGGTLISQQLIQGVGTISVALQNQGPNGQITGGTPTNPLFLTGAVTNSGLISGLGFTTVVFLNNTVQNGGGTISGGPGQVLLNGCTIIGGTLGDATAVPIAVPGGAALKGRASASRSQASVTPLTTPTTPPGGTPTLNGVTIVGQYSVASDMTHTNGTILAGDITNNGTIVVTSPPGEQPAVLFIPGAVSIGGTGQLSVGSQNASIAGAGTLTNLSPHVIDGGEATITVTDLINQSTINGPITIAVHSLNNTNGIVNGATGLVTINGGSVQGGKIVAGSSSGVTLTGGVVLSGVNFTGAADGVVLAVNAVLDGLISPDTIQIIIEIDDNGVLVLEGGVIILSPGEIFLDSASLEFTASLIIEESVTVSGTGQMTTSNSPNNKVAGAAGKKNALTINVPALTAGGTIGDGTFNITIGAHTTVTNNGGYPLIFDVGPNNTFRNLGTLVENSASGMIEIIGNFSNYNTKTNTLAGGTYILDGTFEFPNANLVTNAAKLTLSGNGQILNQNGSNGLLNFADNKGTFELSGDESFETRGTFSNQGNLIISRGSTFTVGGTSTNYNQTAGTTTLDGTLTVPAGGLTDITGGTLQASGNFNGDVSVGNASGAVAAFIIGDSKKTSASVSIANKYTQLATGVMDVQIGGTSAGTQYSELTVTDAVKLAGTLNLAVINKFKPQLGQTFTMLNAPSGITGTFSPVNGTVINSNEHFAVNFDSNSIVLAVESGK